MHPLPSLQERNASRAGRRPRTISPDALLVGEQPGDQEDKQGKPFVGPAGAILAKALADAGIERRTVFVTNAVKHFKFEPRGKRRLHKRPNAYEIDRCHWWLDIERMLVKPEIIVALGATGIRSVSGRPFPINKIRGRVMPLSEGGQMLATIHPTFFVSRTMPTSGRNTNSSSPTGRCVQRFSPRPPDLGR